MSKQSYIGNGLVLTKGQQGAEVRDLQRDLRQLGYLRAGIDGVFGDATQLAVKSLTYDLLSNNGKSRSGDGASNVRVSDYNGGRVFDVTGALDQVLAACIYDMINDVNFPKLPRSDNPEEDNKKILSQIAGMRSTEVPIPFLLAILKQESGLRHFNEPGRGDEDTFIVVGFDTNATEKYIITSRGYGAGQYTLFHHPPRQEEVDDFMLDIGKNLLKAIRELREKFDNFIVGSSSGTRADDRIAEIGVGPLRLCKFIPADPQFMKGCKQCLLDAGSQAIQENTTPLFEGSTQCYLPTQYYKSTSYDDVPIRKNVGCDWPYAVRRYNGSGMNSYHYQAIVMKNLVSFDVI